LRGRGSLPLLAGAALAWAGASLERSVPVDAAGRVAVRLHREVYEAARPDLGDLRVLDETGREVPYVVDRAEPSSALSDLRPAVRNRGWRADGAATAVLDFGGRVAKGRLALRLSGDSFRRRVAVEGGEDGTQWTTLVDEAWVFAVPGPEPARYEAVDLPGNDFPLLRVVAHPAPGEAGRPSIEDAWVPGRARVVARDEPLEPRWSGVTEARAGETWLALDLGARHQPFHALELDVGDGRFFREVRVEARRDPRRPGDPARWEEVGRGAVYRLEHGARRRECLRVEARGRERALRVRVLDRDDRPLQVRAVTVRVPAERLLFEAARPGLFRLTFGDPARPAPSYDLARTVLDVGAWGQAAREAPLGPPRRVATADVDARPWTERQPALAWAALLAVVLALGALTRGALRRAG
jgi:hypothetical protein